MRSPYVDQRRTFLISCRFFLMHPYILRPKNLPSSASECAHGAVGNRRAKAVPGSFERIACGLPSLHEADRLDCLSILRLVIATAVVEKMLSEPENVSASFCLAWSSA